MHKHVLNNFYHFDKYQLGNAKCVIFKTNNILQLKNLKKEAH